jgi:WD40 repeat protein
VTTGQEVRTYKGHTDSVNTVEFSPDGKRLVSSSHDRSVKVWDATMDQDVVLLKGNSPSVTAVIFSPDGKRLAASGTNDLVDVWEVATRKLSLTYGHPRGVYCVAFSRDGKYLASGDGEPEGKSGTVRVWNSETGQTVFSYTVPTGSEVMFTSVAFSPDGERLVAGSPDQPVKAWDLTTGKGIRWAKGQPGAANIVVFSPDGKWLAGCSGIKDRAANVERGDVYVWDALTGEEVLYFQAHPGEVTGLAYSPDGKLLATAGHDHTVKLWDAQTGLERGTLEAHGSAVTTIAFSPDGKRLASGSADKTVKLWDLATGQEVLSLKGHARWVTSVSFSPDGRRLASGTDLGEGLVRVWEAITGE